VFRVFEYQLYSYLSENFKGITWKYKIDELINKLFNSLNELNNKSDLTVRITNLSEELLKTLKMLENCCKNNIEECYLEFYGSVNEIENLLKEREEKQRNIYELNDRLNKLDNILNKKVLCEGCKEKKIEKLTDKCGNEEIARFLYDWRLNPTRRHFFDSYIKLTPFNEFRDIKYLGKGNFGEVYDANFIGYGEEDNVLLKKICNSSSEIEILDVLKEVKFMILIIIIP